MARLEAVLAPFLRSRARPDPGWLSNLLGVEESSVLPFLEEVRDQLDMERAIDRMVKSSGRNYYAQFPAPLELYAMTRIVRPRHIVESGVSSGLSSAHFLMGLRKNGQGKLHSIDLPLYQKARERRRGELSWSIPKGKDSGWAVPPRLRRGWDLRKGKSEEILPGLVQEVSSVDIFCHDSPWTPEHLAFELRTIQPKLDSGSVFVADNTVMNPRAVARLARKFSAKIWRRRDSNIVGIRIPETVRCMM